MITNHSIHEQIRSILDRAALDESSREQVFTEVLKVLRRFGGADLADNDNIKTGGGGDLADNDNIKTGGGGDLADNENIKTGGGGDLAAAANVAEVIELVRAGAALGQAKAITLDLRAIQGKLKGDERARIEKATNQLETALSVIEDGYRKSLNASTVAATAARRRVATGSGRTVHLHLHLE